MTIPDTGATGPGHATLLRGGTVVDGSDSPGWQGDVLLAGERIVSVAAPGRTS